MGIEVEFNPDLALRAFRTIDRLEAECLPTRLEVGEYYQFLKRGQRNYWFGGEIPLLETKGDSRLSRPLASIVILEATHVMSNGEIWTKGRYLVKEVYDINDSKIHFEGMNKVGVEGK